MASFKFVIVCALSAFVVVVNSAKVPPNFELCKRSDPKFNECMARSIKHATKLIVHAGLDSPKLPPLEPIVIDKIEFGSSGGTVNIHQIMKNFKIYGISDYDMSEVNVDLDNCTFHYVTKSPATFSSSEYNMKGNMLFVPIEGNGIANISSTNVRTTHDMKCEFFTKKDGKKYLRVTDYKVDWDAEKVQYSFSNLFNGDKRLSDEVHKIVNENSKIITSELEPAVEKAYGEFFKQYNNKFYGKIPFDELYPEK